MPCLIAPLLFSEETTPALTESEALEIVYAQREAKAALELERKQRILGVEAENETVLDRGSHKMILRRVGWQPLVAQIETESASAGTDTDFSGIVPEHSMISISSTVYDDTFTKVTWREPGAAGTKPINVWVNRNLKYLSLIHQFTQNGVHYSYVGPTQSIDTDAYVTHPVTGEQFPRYDLPDWMPTAEDFPSDTSAYLVVLEDETSVVPQLLYQQMDALLVHFTENEPELLASYQRKEALKKAKAQLDEQEPEAKPDVVINYWPIQSNADL
ncbi:MAG: hypothetical protein AAF065_09385 [Verrucomicrobiota bacterium]